MANTDFFSSQILPIHRSALVDTRLIPSVLIAYRSTRGIPSATARMKTAGSFSSCEVGEQGCAVELVVPVVCLAELIVLRVGMDKLRSGLLMERLRMKVQYECTKGWLWPQRYRCQCHLWLRRTSPLLFESQGVGAKGGWRQRKEEDRAGGQARRSHKAKGMYINTDKLCIFTWRRPLYPVRSHTGACPNLGRSPVRVLPDAFYLSGFSWTAGQ